MPTGKTEVNSRNLSSCECPGVSLGQLTVLLFLLQEMQLKKKNHLGGVNFKQNHMNIFSACKIKIKKISVKFIKLQD